MLRGHEGGCVEGAHKGQHGEVTCKGQRNQATHDEGMGRTPKEGVVYSVVHGRKGT